MKQLEEELVKEDICYDRFFYYASFPQLTFSLISPRHSPLLPEGGILRFCSPITSDF